MEYRVEMRHTEKSFEALAHMQYDLFCFCNKDAQRKPDSAGHVAEPLLRI